MKKKHVIWAWMMGFMMITAGWRPDYGAHIRHLSPLGGLPAKRGEDRFEEGLRS